MLKKDLNEYIISGLKNFFEVNGYKLKKTSELIMFVKNVNDGFQDIAISSTNYYDTHFLSFGYSKRVNMIENVLLDLEKEFIPNMFHLSKSNSTYYLNVSYNQALPSWLKQEIKTEHDVDKYINWIIQYTDKHAFDRFEYLDDVKTVDSEINGDNFWLDEINKPFGLHRFDVYRIVIAKLAKSPDEFENFKNDLLAIEEKRLEQIRQSDEKYKDLENWFVPKILTHLEKIVN
ncbi:MAG TPA: hypothetical protein VF602_07595 [Pedobacter sp.]|jgi:hypothetical protein